MTRAPEKPETARRVVIVFDISSSTTILEDLKRSDNLTVWRDFHINLKTFLQGKTDLMEMEMYKFMGDGWILLFQPNVHSGALFEFLKELTSFVMFQFVIVQRLLHKYPEPTGLTFGVDTGELIRLEMNEQVEYLGRAINVAARLQGEAKRFANRAMSNIALFSKASFNSLQPYDPYIGAENQTVTLRNISGGDQFPCYLISTIAQEGVQEWKQQTDIGQTRGAETADTTQPSQLVVMQKKDSGFFGVKRQGDGAFFVFVTMLIANQSNRANSVVGYKADIMKTNGTYESLKIEQGRTDDFDFCVTPLNIPPCSTIETVVAFISVHPAKYGQPFKMNITVIDVQGKEFTGTVQF
jgi:class 3 adenylate cyclase